MPTYDYECRNCRHTFEAFQSIKEEPLRKCPKCGKASLRRLFGGGMGIIFKGSGFYTTDYKHASAVTGRASSGGASSGGNGSSKSEPKADSKSESKSTGDKTGSTTSK
jgi:putative FmdB family regulatory protein